jgi:Domain of unknown function (DUF4136)
VSNNRYARLSFLFRTSILLIALFFGPTFGWCAGAKTHVDKGPVKARTFSFLDTKQRPVRDDIKQAHAIVQQALIHNLAAKGLTNTPANGDVTVAYLIIAGNNSATTSLNEYFGYTDDSDALVDKVHKQQTSKDSRGYFESGTLVIDILDPKTSKLLQRRSIEAPIMRNLSVDQRSARMQQIVDQALANLPIAP